MNLIVTSSFVLVSALLSAVLLPTTLLRAQTAEPAPSSVAQANAGANTVAALAQQSFVSIARATRPSVVTVRAYVRAEAAQKPADSGENGTQTGGWVETEAKDYPGYRLVGGGSGFVVDAGGDILTCQHLLQRPDGALADLFDVELHDGSRVVCELVGVEPTVNLAILHTMVFPNGHSRQLQALKFGDSDLMECGQWVFGAGDPIGPEKFFAVGTFIAMPTRDCYQDYLSAFHLQAAMVVHPGAHGGPMVNLAGEVIGMLAPAKPKPGGVGVERSLGIEFAEPSKILAGLYDSIRQVRSFQSPWFGFSVMSRPEIASERGLEAFQAMDKPRAGILIENVFRGSPADLAGVQPGDWLVGFDAARIFVPVDFQKNLYLAGIGKTVELEFYRKGETRKVKITVEKRPQEAKPR